MLFHKFPKIILVTGTDINNVDKGILPGSIGALLKANECSVTAIKVDPCLNYNAANLNPSKYGEPYILDDGEVAPLNFGNYERLLNQFLSHKNNITRGKINDFIKHNEIEGLYSGDRVGFNNVVSAIIQKLKDAMEQSIDEKGNLPQICIIELSGAFDDSEMKPFIKAIAYFKFHRCDFMHIHVSKSIGKNVDLLIKSILNLESEHWMPDLIVCRSKKSMLKEVKEELVKFVNLSQEQIINIPETSNLNAVPFLLQERNVFNIISQRLSLENEASKVIEGSNQISQLSDSCTKIVKIALVGKYFRHPLSQNENEIFRDSYASVIQALHDAALQEFCNVEIDFVWAEDLEANASMEKQNEALKKLEESHGIVVTAGFNVPGFSGMMQACKFARENQKPMLAICYGMQCAVIEFAQNVCGIEGAWSTGLWEEQNAKMNNQLNPLKSDQKVIVKMLENEKWRLGRRKTHFLTKNSRLYKLYGAKEFIEERHRHRYEVNPAFVPQFVVDGMKFVGVGFDETLNIEIEDENGKNVYIESIKTLCHHSIQTKTAIRMDIMELSNHPYYVGVEFHPEFLTRSFNPSPPFVGLIVAACQQIQ